MGRNGVVSLLVILGALIIVGAAGYFLWHPGLMRSQDGKVVGERNGHTLIWVQRCSDYCPPEILEKSWVVEYAEGTTPQKCRDMGGYPKRNPAWGGYFGCSPDPLSTSLVYTEPNLTTGLKSDTTTGPDNKTKSGNNCIQIEGLAAGDTVAFPLTVTGVLNPRAPKAPLRDCITIFEGEAGLVRVEDGLGNQLLTEPVLIKTVGDWMVNGTVAFRVDLPGLLKKPSSEQVKIIFAGGNNPRDDAPAPAPEATLVLNVQLKK